MEENDLLKNWDKRDEELYGTRTNKINIFKREMRKMIQLQGETEIKKRTIEKLKEEFKK